MFINEVEHIVGISKKSIRYYEENGLLSPIRNKDNDYRMYTEEDVRKLRVIKFLRELNVSIRELKDLACGNLSLVDCMKERVAKIEMEEVNYKKIKDMCNDIINSNQTYEDINIDEYFRNINVLNKEGFTMRDLSTNKRKKIMECIISSVVFSLFFVFFIWLFTYLQMTEEEQMPWALYWFMVVMFGFPIIGIIYNLVLRIKEINGGEEDEASKY